MTTTLSKYDSIMHMYDSLGRERHRIIEERKKEVYEKVPEYRSIEKEIAVLSVKAAKASLSGSKVDDIDEQIENLHIKKNLILTNAGFSINYLEPPYNCPLCKDTGFIEGTACSCYRQAALDIAYKQTNVINLIKEENFDNISYEYQIGENLERFMKAETLSKDFVNTFDTADRNIIFMGTVGTGKSFLSNCIANEIIKQGYSLIYFSAISLFENISSYKFGKSTKDFHSNPLEDIYSCDLLIIDDLGSEIVNQFVCSELFEIINERHLRKKSTVISTNLSLKDINDRYSGRIFSRLCSYYEFCTLSGDDIRIFKKRNRK